jgi:hypothetical protein
MSFGKIVEWYDSILLQYFYTAIAITKNILISSNPRRI